MGMQINTNLAANNTYRNLNATQNDLSKSLEKLSSGLRINRAADDAAGLAISEGLRSQVGGLTVAARNAQDGISVVQTAEGGLTEVHSILQRVRDLAVQAGNDSNNAESRKAISTEVTALTDELSRISTSTKFNGTSLLDSNQSLKFQVGANGSTEDQITVDLSGANVTKITAALGTGSTASGTTFAVTTADLVGGATATFKSSVGTADVSEITTGALKGSGTAGAFKSVDEYATALNGDATFSANFKATTVRNADGAATGIAVTALNGGTVDVTAPADGIAAGDASGTTSTGISFESAAAAQNAIKVIDQQITNVSTARSNLGAVQNRFEHAINVTNVAKENLTAAESRIRDTDMAQEMVKYTRSNILSQAGTAMLAQANQSTQGVLSLLR
ncbi:flagellin [Frigoribacterium sp. VKM Ac-1396]|uniref:flagellin N-terminal helical domain-containing protein n=1 Tax=Frigoribacterium sp. VKM Ac-1396 TaxID=2783821 RepID=UPI00188A0424|nr:flagellin [Frigoribacterium sp. VKM Ac-1396]MBF4600727.1 flagellin [Frigoribacterium sp. VKM Ac-1396]